MDEREQDTIVFEDDSGAVLQFNVVHEFYRDGEMYAVLQSAGDAGDTLIAQVVDPLGPDEEFVPLPLNRQQALLDYLNRGCTETD